MKNIKKVYTLLKKPHHQFFFSTSRYKIIQSGTHLYLQPKSTHSSTLIWLHGLGDNAAGNLRMFNDPEFPIKLTPDNMKVILLTAPFRRVTKNDNQKFNSWFDMKRKDWQDQITILPHDQLFGIDEIKESFNFITDIMNKEREIVGDKLFIGGFSQGCAMALYAGLQFNHKIQGILGFSGFLFPSTTIVQRKSNILLSHGTLDDVIQLQTAQDTYKKLFECNVRLEIIKGLKHSYHLNSFQIMQEYLQQ